MSRSFPLGRPPAAAELFSAFLGPFVELMLSCLGGGESGISRDRGAGGGMSISVTDSAIVSDALPPSRHGMGSGWRTDMGRLAPEVVDDAGEDGIVLRIRVEETKRKRSEAG